MTLWQHVILFVMLLMLSAAFSASETALFSLSPFQRRRLQLAHPGTGGAVARLLEQPRRTLISILIGNLIVNVWAVTICTSIAVAISPVHGGRWSLIIMTLLLLTLCEVTPKTAAIRNPESTALYAAVPLELFSRVIYPLRRVLRVIADFFLVRVSGEETSGEPFITQNELEALVKVGEEEGILDRDEREMIHTVFEFGERSCHEIMTPRVDIAGCEDTASREEVTEVMRSSRHTKIPVFHESLDHIAGYVSTKEFLLSQTHLRQDWFSLIRPVSFVPATMKLDELLQEFRRQGHPVAIIVDEYGGTAGLVTLEDVLEEVVGEIQDEHDLESALVQRLPGGVIHVNGDLTIHDLEEETGIELKSDEAETVGGVILELAGHIPDVGDEVVYDRWRLIVEQMEEHRIVKVSVRPQPLRDDAEEGSS